MRNEGLFSVTELIVQRIPGVKIFPMSIFRIFFNHKHCFVFWAFSMSHWSLTQTAICIKYVKSICKAQGVFNHSISLNSQFLMCNAWATIIVSFLKHIYYNKIHFLEVEWPLLMIVFQWKFLSQTKFNSRIYWFIIHIMFIWL